MPGPNDHIFWENKQNSTNLVFLKFIIAASIFLSCSKNKAPFIYEAYAWEKNVFWWKCFRFVFKIVQIFLKIQLREKKGVPSAESSRSVRGLGKGVSGKPYPRLCNARRPRLEPGTFQSQAVRLYRLHQARPSQLRESETKYSKKHTSASRDVLESPFTEHNCEKSDAHLTAFLNRPNM